MVIYKFGGFMTETIGARIKKIRELQNLKQGELAAKIGITQQGFAAIEKRATMPKNLNEIAKALGVNYDYLRDGTEPKYPQDNDNAGLSKVVNSSNENDASQLLFSPQDIKQALPVAFERTVISLAKYLKNSEGEDLDVFKHKEMISSLLGFALASELTGDYSELSEGFNKLEKKSS